MFPHRGRIWRSQGPWTHQLPDARQSSYLNHARRCSAWQRMQTSQHGGLLISLKTYRVEVAKATVNRRRHDGGRFESRSSPVSTRTIHGTFVGSHVNSDAYLPLSWSTKSRKASRIHRHGSKIGTERPGPWSTTAGADGNFPGLSPSEIEKLARPDQMRPQRGNDRGAPGRTPSK